MGWSLEVSGIATFGALVSRIVREVLELGYGFRHADKAWRAPLRIQLDLLDSWS